MLHCTKVQQQILHRTNLPHLLLDTACECDGSVVKDVAVCDAARVERTRLATVVSLRPPATTPILIRRD